MVITWKSRDFKWTNANFQTHRELLPLENLGLEFVGIGEVSAGSVGDFPEPLFDRRPPLEQHAAVDERFRDDGHNSDSLRIFHWDLVEYWYMEFQKRKVNSFMWILETYLKTKTMRDSFA